MKCLASLVVCVSLWSAFAAAQETTGMIVGSVTSEDGAPLPGVTVQVEDLERGLLRTALSDRAGDYSVAALPPESYQLTAALEGFRPVERTVRVQLGRTVSSDIQMQVAAFTADIEVSDEVPMVDVTSTVSGFTVDSDDLLSNMPMQREVTKIAMLAPGTFAADNYWQEANYTGLMTPGQALVSFSGSSFGENSYQVNGLNITNFRYMIGASFVPMEFVDEVQVKTGGYEAEFGRATGGVINMVTKSGTNSFRGGLSAYWEPESLQEQEPDALWNLNQHEMRESLEANASLGGPIVRDRLFFFGFVRYSDSAYTDVYTGMHDLLETSTPYWGIKLDWNMSANHRLEGTFISDEVTVVNTRSGYDGDTGTILGELGVLRRNRGGNNFILKYTGILTPELLISAQAGRNEFERSTVSDGEECPFVLDDRVEGQGFDYPLCWTRRWRSRHTDTRDAYRFDMDWFIGDHSLRAGADYELNLSYINSEYSGGVYYNYYLNGTEDGDPQDFWVPWLPWDQNLVSRRISSNSGDFEVNSSAAYVQDSWSVTPNLTLNLGVRWESYENKNGLGGTFIETDDQWAPRLGAIWDPSGAGHSKIYASYGTYHMPVSSLISIAHAGSRYADETWYTFDGEVDPVYGSPIELGDQLAYFLWADGEIADPRENTSENFEPMAQDEVIVGYEQMLGSTWSVGVRGVARWYRQVLEDFSIYEGLWNTYGVPCLDPELIGTAEACLTNGFRLGNPGRDFEGWYDLDGDGELDRVTVPAEELGYPSAQRDYYAVELTFARRFSDNWMLNGSYTWSHLYGNYEGTISDESRSGRAGMTRAFDYPYMMEHSTGDLPADRRHNLKLYGVYSWDFGLQTGGNLFYQTGRPINSYGRHPTDPWAHADPLESYYTDGQPRPQGCCGRTEDIWSLDVMLKYDFRAAAIDCTVRLDIFNVIDNHATERVWPVAEDARTGMSYEGYYGETEYYQRPRGVRLGFGLSF